MPAKPPRTRLAADDRRELIVQAARRVISVKGLDGISVREIASESGVSIGTVTHHFASLSEILAAVLKQESNDLRDRLAEAIADRRSVIDGLESLNEAYLTDEPGVRSYWALWLASCARAPHDPQLAAWIGERYEAWRETVRALLVEGIETGEIGPVDPDSVAVELVALLDGYAIQAFFNPSPPDLPEAREMLRKLVSERLAK